MLGAIKKHSKKKVYAFETEKMKNHFYALHAKKK